MHEVIFGKDLDSEDNHTSLSTDLSFPEEFKLSYLFFATNILDYCKAKLDSKYSYTLLIELLRMSTQYIDYCESQLLDYYSENQSTQKIMLQRENLVENAKIG